MSRYQDLLDYRRRVSALYAEVRRGEAAEQSFETFQTVRNQLFARHSQSPLSETQRADFAGLEYFSYDPAYRFVLPLDLDVEKEVLEVQLQADGLLRLERFARVHFELAGQPVTLSLFWLQGYGGGVFLPFRDATNDRETYGGGRYLLDTVKGADLGASGNDRLVFDFNYAYNPSCAYNSHWACPLAPPENRLSVKVQAGELRFG